MLQLKNLADATLASLSILRKSRWRPKWQQIIGLSQNIAADCIQHMFYMQIPTENALLIKTCGDSILAWIKKIIKISRMPPRWPPNQLRN